MSSAVYHQGREGNGLLSTRLITLGDLYDFRQQLLSDIRLLLKEFHGQPVKRWLKSHEVKKLLNISTSTLQILRKKKALPFTKIGGVLYYDSSEITRLLASQPHTSKNS